MIEHYILKNGQPVKPPDLATWSEFMSSGNRQVSLTLMIIKGERVHVSTTFLGIDHRYGQGTPLLFETMVFGGLSDGDQARYTSMNDAKRGHKFFVKDILETWKQ